jgi:hypothetical protein
LSFVKANSQRIEILSDSSDDEEEELTTNVVNYNSCENNTEFPTTSNKISSLSKNNSVINYEEEIIEEESTTSHEDKFFKSTSLVIKEEAPKFKKASHNLFHRSHNIVDIADFNTSSTHIKIENNIKKEHIQSSVVAYELIKKMRKHVKETYPNLVLPGNILYIYKIESNDTKKGCCHLLCSKICCCFYICKTNKEIAFDSRWASRDEFKKILITNRMLLDHFPNTVDDALNYFNTTSPTFFA